MKERIISICLLLLAAVTVWLIVAELPKKGYARPSSDFTESIRSSSFTNQSSTASAVSTDRAVTAPSVAQEVIRLHILADNDSERDQAIKLALRDVLLPYLNAATLTATSKKEALSLLSAQCSSLTDIANAALARWNSGYTATVSIQSVYFPIRIYGSQTYLSSDAVIFPPGFYDSVQVILGRGEGHNWWCLAYPSLCFIDAAYDYIPKDSDHYKQKVGSLPESELNELFYGAKPSYSLHDSERNQPDNEIDIYFGNKLLELLKNIF